ncbi:phospholipase A1 [Megalopta genalis]|uniref:phospholipase A1 n=1 Tax=Megalopta genalis TaxID=115081 RepID=UPI003FD0ADB9
MSKLFNILFLGILIAKDTVVAGLCDLKIDPAILQKIHLQVYKGDSSSFTFTESHVTNPEIIAQDIVHGDETILYVHGFMEDTSADNVMVIPKAYLDKGGVNVIVVDWGEIALNINYLYVSSQVPYIGKAIAESMEKLADVIDLNTLHVIGHSLGAHIASHISKFMNVTLNRLTGLDPAFPLFYPSACHIKKTDAETVVILHTDAGFYGTPIDTGTVDFYANKGVSPQPGCPIIIGGEICSHQRSTKIFAESVTNPEAFPSRRCIARFKDGERVYFNDSTPKNLHGAYCFNTNKQSPFGQQS